MECWWLFWLYWYTYALNNPLRFTDPSGYTYRPPEIDEEKRKWKEGPGNYYSGLNSGYNRNPFANAFSYLNASGGWEFSGPTGGYVNRQTGERMSADQFNAQVLDPSFLPSTANYSWEAIGTLTFEGIDQPANLYGRVYSDASNSGNGLWSGALTFAAGAVVIDGPLPIGDAVAAVTVATVGAISGTKAASDYLKSQGVQYTLRAKTSGNFPVFRFGSALPSGTQFLNAGDIWKIGQTVQFNFATGRQYRYPQSQLDAWGVQFVPEFRGTRPQIMLTEKMKIWQYIHLYDALPAGNKVPW